MAAGGSLRLLFLIVSCIALVAGAMAVNNNNVAFDAAAGGMGGEQVEPAGHAARRGSRNPGRGRGRFWVEQWCIAQEGVSPEALQKNIDFACGSSGVDCGPIQNEGECFYPDTVKYHANFAMNAYYQHYWQCYFDGTGTITFDNPSYGKCRYWVRHP